MSDLIYSLPFQVVLVLLVSAAYAAWIWSRLSIGRYDALICSAGIIVMQLIASFRTADVPMSLVAVAYHFALVGAVFSTYRGYAKEKERVKVKVKA